MNSPQRLFLIDGMALFYRAHFAMSKNPLITRDGRHTSGVYGFLNILFKLIRDEQPEYIAVAMDSPEPTFRHKAYTEYKATREKMPDELVEQLDPLFRIIAALQIPMFKQPGWEADDIIGTLAAQADGYGLHTFMVTGDKDMAQLVSDSVFLYTPGNRFKPTTVYDRSGVIEKWGVPPEKIIEYLTLVGDSSDNVPGVDGVGVKTAVKLLNEYGSLNEIFNHADEVRNKRVRNGLNAGKELAQLSRELVIIRQDAPLELHMKELKRQPFDREKVEKLFHELEMLSLIKQVDELDIGQISQPAQPAKEYRTLRKHDEIDEMIAELKGAPLISFDLETTSVRALEADIVGLSFAVRPHHGWYIPVLYPETGEDYHAEQFLEWVLNRLKPLFENSEYRFCGQNIKYDALVLSRYDIRISNIAFDTMVAAHLLAPDRNSYKMDYLALEELNYQMVPISDLIGTGRSQITMDQVPLEKTAFYAAEDADIALQLCNVYQKQLEDENLDRLYSDIELPLIPVLIQMEREGVYLDLEYLHELSENIQLKLTDLTERIYELAGKEFNINSPQQLGGILFDELKLKPIRKRSTDVNVLERLKDSHPLPGEVLSYRHFKKLKSTYIDAFPDYVNSQSGRIHTSLNQTIAVTGRLSSTQPNFQNIPIRTDMGKEIRKAFCAQHRGWLILSADYSQVELRIMAHFSQEEALLEAFRKGDDIHRQTACQVYNESPEDVTPEMRRTAKIVNFGIMYGAGPFRMSQELGISMASARELIDNYFRTYPGIRSYIDETLAQARSAGFVQTLFGRKKLTRNLMSNRVQVVQAEERAAINMPIQGTAAEVIKLAMMRIHDRLMNESWKTRMILQIHDELLFEVPENELEPLAAMVVHEMENAAELSVPLKVDYGVGTSWYDAH